MKTFFLSILSFNWWRMLYNVVLASATQQCKSAIIIINHLLFEPSPLTHLTPPGHHRVCFWALCVSATSHQLHMICREGTQMQIQRTD